MTTSEYAAIDLQNAANIARSAGRRAVRDVMDSRWRDSPWEINERWMQIAIAQAFHKFVHNLPQPRIRVFDELVPSEISNIAQHPKTAGRTIDLVLLYPLKDPKRDRFGQNSGSNKAAYGLVEVKKGSRLVNRDAKKLYNLVSRYNGRIPRPKWLLLVSLINGGTPEAAALRRDKASGSVAQYGFSCVTAWKPQQPTIEDNGEVVDRWFDVVCFGHKVR